MAGGRWELTVFTGHLQKFIKNLGEFQDQSDNVEK
jgi:hypothetical protein